MTDFEPITKDVTGLQFSIMSPDEIRKNSVACKNLFWAWHL